MSTHCRFCLTRPPFSVIRAVAIGVVLSVVLPANAIETGEFRRITSRPALESASERTTLTTPVLALDNPARADVSREDSERSSRFGTWVVALRGPSNVGRSGFFQWASAARPALSILPPRDGAAVPAGILHVQGTTNGNGSRVRVLVNGVRALVEGGTFTAGVRGTPNTMILGAVATTERGATARHQIELTVSETVETTFPLHPMAEYGAAEPVRRLSLLPAVTVKTGRGGDGAGDTHAAGSGALRFAFARGARHSPPVPTLPAAGTTEAATMALVLAPVSLDEHRFVKESGQPEMRPQADVEGVRSALVISSGLESRAEPPTLKQREVLAPVTPDVQPLLLGRSREGEVGDNFRRMRPGSDYSFGMLFILDSDGLWRLRWF